MPFQVEMRIEGLDLLMHQMRDFKKSSQNRVVRPANVKAMRIVARDAKQRAKAIKDTGLLSKSIGAKTKTYKHAVVTVVGPRKGFKQLVKRRITDFERRFFETDKRKKRRERWADPAKYAHLVEKGTRDHVIIIPKPGRSGKHKIKIKHKGSPPKPFLRPALLNNRSLILSVWMQAAREALQKEFARIAAKVNARSRAA